MIENNAYTVSEDHLQSLHNGAEPVNPKKTESDEDRHSADDSYLNDYDEKAEQAYFNLTLFWGYGWLFTTVVVTVILLLSLIPC